MGLKRKAAALPNAISMGSSKEEDGPFVVQFPSGFNPVKAADEIEWEAFSQEEEHTEHALVAKTVRILSQHSDQGMHCPLGGHAVN